MYISEFFKVLVYCMVKEQEFMWLNLRLEESLGDGGHPKLTKVRATTSQNLLSAITMPMRQATNQDHKDLENSTELIGAKQNKKQK